MDTISEIVENLKHTILCATDVEHWKYIDNRSKKVAVENALEEFDKKLKMISIYLRRDFDAKLEKESVGELNLKGTEYKEVRLFNYKLIVNGLEYRFVFNSVSFKDCSPKIKYELAFNGKCNDISFANHYYIDEDDTENSYYMDAKWRIIYGNGGLKEFNLKNFLLEIIRITKWATKEDNL